MLTFTKFELGFRPTLKPAKRAVWLIWRGRDLLVGQDYALPTALPDGMIALFQAGIGCLYTEAEQLEAIAVEIAAETPLPEGLRAVDLRRFYYRRFDETLFMAAGRAYQMVDWRRTHRFCGRCGTATNIAEIEAFAVCPNCKLRHYPRVHPAIIVAITKGDQLLLAHNVRHPDGLYSILAGFVEPGESLEQCVAREVKEEAGIDVTNIRYVSSQPWPFPHSLMVGFTAEYAGGELVPEEGELEEVGWYSADKLPTIPPKISIARQLIDAFVAEQTSA